MNCGTAATPSLRHRDAAARESETARRHAPMGKRKAEGESSAKKKKEKTDDDDEGAPPKTYQERLKALSPISSPLADEKLTKRRTRSKHVILNSLKKRT